MRGIKLGILGVGHIGLVHLQSAQVLDGVSVVAAADAVSSNRKLARQQGVPQIYSNYEDLLDNEAVDAVVVALPPSLHEEATTRAAEAGCDVFVEKPFARSSSEAKRMIEVADDAGVWLGVDHTLRYQSEMTTVKSAYDAGRIGHVPLCHVARINSGPFDPPPPTDAVPEWPLDPQATGGGAVMDLGVHLFDLLEWLFGEMEICHAELDRQLDVDYETSASIMLRSSTTGTVATMHCGFYQWETPPEVNMRVVLDGVADTIESTDYVPDFYRHVGTAALKNIAKRLVGSDPDYFEPTYYYRAHYRALRDFLDAVLADRAPPVGGAEGLRTLELVEEAYRCAGATTRDQHQIPPLEREYR
ncbi:Gfo/Idh/MocA family protein [Halorarius litoreus]|uniref:Gfo/Idh/MocA family protein n=1 Tax=Halorarius litoreus TaxID=2962676 RepID=UPI0020CD5480|nr:Gfo/Idh/MocA family oxidoreductase [Halorarius litoreus]